MCDTCISACAADADAHLLCLHFSRCWLIPVFVHAWACEWCFSFQACWGRQWPPPPPAPGGLQWQHCQQLSSSVPQQQQWHHRSSRSCQTAARQLFRWLQHAILCHQQRSRISTGKLLATAPHTAASQSGFQSADCPWQINLMLKVYSVEQDCCTRTVLAFLQLAFFQYFEGSCCWTLFLLERTLHSMPGGGSTA